MLTAIRKGEIIVRNGNGDLIGRMLKIARESDEQADWRDLALRLRKLLNNKNLDLIQKEEAILRVAKAMRDADALEKSVAVYSVASPIISIAEIRMTMKRDINPALDAISQKIEAIEEKHGLAENEFWLRGEGPNEYKQLQDEFDRVWKGIIAATFDEYGEPDLAAMYRYQPDEFDRLYEEGRKQIFEKPRRKRRQ